MGELLNVLAECVWEWCGEWIVRSAIVVAEPFRRRDVRPRAAPPRGDQYAYRKARSINDI